MNRTFPEVTTVEPEKWLHYFKIKKGVEFNVDKLHDKLVQGQYITRDELERFTRLSGFQRRAFRKLFSGEPIPRPFNKYRHVKKLEAEQVLKGQIKLSKAPRRVKWLKSNTLAVEFVFLLIHLGVIEDQDDWDKVLYDRFNLKTNPTWRHIQGRIKPNILKKYLNQAKTVDDNADQALNKEKYVQELIDIIQSCKY